MAKKKKVVNKDLKEIKIELKKLKLQQLPTPPVIQQPVQIPQPQFIQSPPQIIPRRGMNIGSFVNRSFMSEPFMGENPFSGGSPFFPKKRR